MKLRTSFFILFNLENESSPLQFVSTSVAIFFLCNSAKLTYSSQRPSSKSSGYACTRLDDIFMISSGVEECKLCRNPSPLTARPPKARGP